MLLPILALVVLAAIGVAIYFLIPFVFPSSSPGDGTSTVAVTTTTLTATSTTMPTITQPPAPAPPAASIAPMFINSLGMEFRLVPTQTFYMGSPQVEVARSGEERMHKVTLTKPFYIMTTEVTQAQWKKVMGGEPSQFGGGDLPVENVTFGQVEEFLNRLNQMVRPHLYRLPTEAEWECACRAGTHTPFNVGGQITPRDALYDYQYSYAGAPTSDSPESTRPVSSFPPNRWGLYDMHGNVSEWVSDWYQPDYYQRSPAADPKGPASGDTRVVRGGSWYADPAHLRCADRQQAGPEEKSNRIGLRLVLDPQAR